MFFVVQLSYLVVQLGLGPCLSLGFLGSMDSADDGITERSLRSASRLR